MPPAENIDQKNGSLDGRMDKKLNKKLYIILTKKKKI